MVYSKIYNKVTLTKTNLLGKLREALTMAVANKASRFFLYYTGHGDSETGGWKTFLKELSLEFTANTISIEEILDVVKETKFSGHMEITSDSCFSGLLCHAAREYWMKKEHNYPLTL